MFTFDWKPFVATDLKALSETRKQIHQAIQGIAAVGRRFLPPSRYDENATLTWVPGLSRMAGKWVNGEPVFRTSLGFEDLSLHLVDEKVNTIASFFLEDTTQRQVILWLEEQIGKFGLDMTNFAMNLPYNLPRHATQEGAPFRQVSKEVTHELAKYFHNSFIVLRDLKQQFDAVADISIWPHHFDEALRIVIKPTGDPETDFSLTAGMSPGDSRYDEPYFYVSTWPHVDINTLPGLENGASWIEDDWTGAVFRAKHTWGGGQEALIRKFFGDTTQVLIRILRD